MVHAIYFILASLVYGSIQCGHTTDFDSDLQSESSAPGRSLIMSDNRSSTQQPIRIYLHYFNMNLSTELEFEFKNQLMRTVQDFYQRRLLVYPMKENLKLTGFTRCSTITIPTEHLTVGIEADLIIYVIGNTYSGENWVARAGACILESKPYNNVLAGRIEINAALYTSNLSFEDKMQTIIHEIYHILGFSNTLYQYFHKNDGSSYSSSELTQTIYSRGKLVTLFKTPTVVAKAQAAFGCTTMLGLELEDGGGSGTAGSHWEKRMMFNDFMIGDIGPTDVIYSDITFGLLKDSGWYDINWDYTDSTYYGKGKGCNFYDKKCVINGLAQFPEFCTSDMGVPKCDFLRLNKGSCTKVTLSSTMPACMNYFNSTTIGGIDSYLDYCPIVTSYNNGSCRGTGASSTNLAFGSGESVSISSRCFEHSLLVNSYSYYAAYQNIRAGCYPVKCEVSTYKVTIGSVEVTCNPGQQISVSGFQGILVCPEYNDICKPVPCPYGCRGVGKCLNGLCQCDSGYGGNDCSIQCDSSCKNCNGLSSASCTSCPIGSTLLAGSCSLSQSCPTLCNSCSTSSICTSCVLNATKSLTGSCTCNSGYTSQGGQCIQPCNDLCTSCSSSGCLTCKSNSSIASNSISLCACNSGYFYSNGICAVQCNDLCSSCSVTGCTACKLNSFLKSGSTTECGCNTGYVYSNGQCVLQCNDLCLNCSSTGCTQCKANSYVSSLASNCSCMTGYTEVNGSCSVQCNELCTSCGENGCNQCVVNSSLKTGSVGDCECNPGMSKSGNSCVAMCNDLCSSCGVSSCNSCKANSLQVLTNPSTCQCNTGYYYLGGVCYPICNSLCQYCTLSGCNTCKPNAELSNPNNCQCKAGYTVINGVCTMECNDLCSSCSSAGCTTCKLNSSLSLTNVCQCNPGFRYFSGQCLSQCNSLCGICDSTGCLQCAENSKLVSTDPFSCGCNTGYSMLNGKCVYQCNELCETCENYVCKACKANSYVIAGSLNRCECGAGFKFENGQCRSMCNELCDHCENSGCSLCKAHSVVISSNIYSCSCNDGYYHVAGECVSLCNDLCLECTLNGCSQCKPNSSINQSNTSSCTCNLNYNYSNSACESVCNSSCLRCSSTGCTECELNTVLSPENVYNCIAGSNNFLSPNQNQPITSCDISCGLCTDDGFSCAACRNDAYLQDNKCLCRAGYIMNTISGECESIHN